MLLNRLSFNTVTLIVIFRATLVLEGQVPRGRIIDTLDCLNHPDQTYSIYIPATHEGPLPLLIFLEPAARGSLPVTLYRDLAEKYGLILACSNKGRNGPPELYRDALDAMIPDLIHRFAPDTGRIVLSGFSGGARYATVYSSIRMKAGVIACGAGLSPYYGEEQLGIPLYIGIIGTRDMNFIDVVNSIKKARDKGIRTWMVTTERGHFWPDTSSFRRALDQVRAYWYAEGLIELPEKEVQRIKQDMYAQIDTLLASHKLYEITLMEENLEANPFFDEDDPGWTEIASRFPDEKMKKKISREWSKIKNREMNYFDSVQSAIQDINLALYNQTDKLRPDSWWKAMGRQVKRSMNSKEPIEMESGYRMYDYTARSCWSWGSPYLDNPQEAEQAARYFEAWCSFDPADPEAWYWLATAFARGDRKKDALDALAESLELGFPVDRINSTKAFETLRSDPRYLNLLRGQEKGRAR